MCEGWLAQGEQIQQEVAMTGGIHITDKESEHAGVLVMCSVPGPVAYEHVRLSLCVEVGVVSKGRHKLVLSHMHYLIPQAQQEVGMGEEQAVVKHSALDSLMMW